MTHIRSAYIYNQNINDSLSVKDARKIIDDVKANYNTSDTLRQEMDNIMNWLGSAETSTEVPEGVVDNVNPDFLLSATPLDPGRMTVKLDGRHQYYITDYSVNGNKITFLDPPAVNTLVEVTFKWWREIDLSPRPYAFTMKGAINPPQNIYILPSVPQDLESVMILVDGIEALQGTDYRIEGSNVIMTFAPALRSVLFCYYDYLSYPSPFTIPINETAVEIPDLVITEFTMSFLPKYKEGVLVKLNGGIQYFNIDYTIENRVVTFTTPPAVNTTVHFYYNTSISGELAMTREKFTQLLDKFALHPFLLMGA